MKNILCLLFLIPFSAYAATGHGYDQLLAALSQQISHDKGLEKIEIKLNNHREIGDFELVSVSYGSQKGKIQAHIVTEGQQQSISGIFGALIKVPVLKKAGHRGQVIQEQDLHWVDMPESALRYNAITDCQFLLGKELKSNHPANKPLFSQAVLNAKIMKKGALVTMYFNKRNLHIETKGMALEDGGLGETIKVKNASSGKVIQAKIVNAGAVMTDGG